MSNLHVFVSLPERSRRLRLVTLLVIASRACLSLAPPFHRAPN